MNTEQMGWTARYYLRQVEIEFAEFFWQPRSNEPEPAPSLTEQEKGFQIGACLVIAALIYVPILIALWRMNSK